MSPCRAAAEMPGERGPTHPLRGCVVSVGVCASPRVVGRGARGVCALVGCRCRGGVCGRFCRSQWVCFLCLVSSFFKCGPLRASVRGWEKPLCVRIPRPHAHPRRSRCAGVTFARRRVRRPERGWARARVSPPGSFVSALVLPGDGVAPRRCGSPRLCYCLSPGMRVLRARGRASCSRDPRLQHCPPGGASSRVPAREPRLGPVGCVIRSSFASVRERSCTPLLCVLCFLHLRHLFS